MKVSLVVPAHNEAGNLTRLVERVTSEFSPSIFSHTLEVVLVVDNSTDETPQIVDRLAAEYESVTPVHRTKDGGFGNAIKAGLTSALG
ncbi:glycosyltransferase [Halogeometricum borinquense]|uniref:glycosyltransferase n=1 Tax=Halogeometricum borinquense TaxID=60847 RepID=UPI0023BB1468|nr:glycosyltransferase [Halogeometricum borinquense]